MSIRSRQAGRDAASFDDDRKDGRFGRPGQFPAAGVSDWGSRPGDAAKQAALEQALAKIERAFGKGAVVPAIALKEAA